MTWKIYFKLNITLSQPTILFSTSAYSVKLSLLPPFSVVHILDYGYFKSKIYIVLLKEENPVTKHFMKPINLFYTQYPWNTALNVFLHQI